ncbi:FecR family protein [Puia dinghuensis]|uniref:Iron dicitrate transporter FecR n=1 Tax=Puia dinghuensis TaxID=1792502 RepID=A0A8J2UD55_9BACT|nr:FecR family protein [Puia dinghuensis]GGB00922.1 iron dicitrate transporter FecR [Puia dinghuensis]
MNTYLSGKLTPQQHQELISLLEQEDVANELDQLLRASAGEFTIDDELPATENRIIQGLLQKIEQRPAPSTPVKRLIRKWSWAAAVLLILGTGAYLWLAKGRPTPVVASRLPLSDVAPGGNKAVLTLADGRAVLLDSTANGTIALQGSTTVVKSSDGQLIYRPKGSTATTAGLLNTLRTPRGGQYHVTLPDGTGVWLNSASAITYPTSFADDQRKVSISGEAYIEVATQKDKPFLVDVDGRGAIEVLGTAFNVNSYVDEAAITTTLINGGIRVSDRGLHQVILKPGEQAHAGTDGLTIVHHPDIDKVMAWKNGFFNFENVHLGEVMRQIQRWYDVDVIYEKGIPDIQFEGEISRNIKLSDLLKVLARAEVKFRLEEGRRLVVLP